ncbi:hypothetical protein SG34_009975 [Thalassomonas viridans]|uniref:Uncharacterized protein n=1 Tax=Thalassomonas viridans TaxID=137584 RepID=A0AAF0CC81_9GAMM|nr:hypothetical protein [Thalassomonas viridans]WDE07184.1 hypothetical protein SG34_009975 [Thalassomonas viridans]
MEIQSFNFFPLVLAGAVTLAVLAFSRIEKKLRQVVIAHLYHEAAFYEAYRLLLEYDRAVGENPDAGKLALIDKKIALYLRQVAGLAPVIDQGRVVVTPPQYRQLTQAHRILMKNYNFIVSDMSAKDRILTSAMLKIDSLHYGERYFSKIETTAAEREAMALVNS